MNTFFNGWTSTCPSTFGFQGQQFAQYPQFGLPSGPTNFIPQPFSAAPGYTPFVSQFGQNQFGTGFGNGFGFNQWGPTLNLPMNNWPTNSWTNSNIPFGFSNLPFAWNTQSQPFNTPFFSNTWPQPFGGSNFQTAPNFTPSYTPTSFTPNFWNSQINTTPNFNVPFTQTFNAQPVPTSFTNPIGGYTPYANPWNVNTPATTGYAPTNPGYTPNPTTWNQAAFNGTNGYVAPNNFASTGAACTGRETA